MQSNHLNNIWCCTSFKDLWRTPVLRLSVCCFHPLRVSLNSSDKKWNRYCSFSKASTSLKNKKKKEKNEIAVSCSAYCVIREVFCAESTRNVCININRKEFPVHESLDCQWSITVCHRHHGAKLKYCPEFYTPVTGKKWKISGIYNLGDSRCNHPWQSYYLLLLLWTFWTLFLNGLCNWI